MSRFCVQATWDDVPHLTDEAKKDLWNSIPIHQRDARSKGVPVLGSGAIYPIAEETILEDPIEIPSYWPRAYALDVGWNTTAAIWGTWDKEADVVHIYSEYYAGHMPPAVHVMGIQARGDWMVGAIDPGSSGSSQVDGRSLIDEYRKMGLALVEADNTVEAGILAVFQRMARGGLKVSTHCRSWLSEFRIYRRDMRGHVVKNNDHLMDATRYLIMTGMRYARVSPETEEEREYEMELTHGRSQVTGY